MKSGEVVYLNEVEALVALVGDVLGIAADFSAPAAVVFSTWGGQRACGEHRRHLSFRLH